VGARYNELAEIVRNVYDSTSGGGGTTDSSTFVTKTRLNDSLAHYVPYSGADSNVDLGTHSLAPKSILFDVTPNMTSITDGELYFDTTNYTLSVQLDSAVNLQIGQEFHVRALNRTGSTIVNGKVVYINDAQGNRPTIALANPDSVNSSQVIGVTTEDIPYNSTGFVTVMGVVNDVNTFGLTDGGALYLDTASGKFTQSILPAPHNVVPIGYALNSTVHGAIFVRPQSPIASDTTFSVNGTQISATQKAIKSYVDKRVKYTDTSTMLSHYLKNAVTSIQFVGGTGVSVSPTTAITSTGVVTVSATGSLSAGTGMSVTGSFPTYTVTNTSPSSGGTVTSVGTGYGLSGGTITSSGTLTLDTTTAFPAVTGTLAGGYGITKSSRTFIVDTATTFPASASALAAGYGLSKSARTFSVDTATTFPASTGTLAAGYGLSKTGRTFLVDSSTTYAGSTGTLAGGYGITKSGRTIIEDTATTFTKIASTFAVGYGLNYNGRTFKTDTATLFPAVRSTISSGGTPGGTSGQVQYNSSSTFAGASGVTIAADGQLVRPSTTVNPTVPSAGNLKVYSNNINGIDEYRFVPSVGTEVAAQNSVGVKLVGGYYPAIGGGTLITWGHLAGATALTSSVSATTVNKLYDATNLAPNYTAEVYTVSSAANNISVGILWNGSAARSVVAGNNTYGGGSKTIQTFTMPVPGANQRLFMGYYANSGNAPATTTDPSTWINTIGVAKDAGDANLQIIWNDGSGNATKNDLGIALNANNVYRVTVFIPPNMSTAYPTINLEVMTKSSITNYTYTPTTNIFGAGTLLQNIFWANTGSGTTQIKLGLINVYEEQY
jgi:hypothetical protein